MSAHSKHTQTHKHVKSTNKAVICVCAHLNVSICVQELSTLYDCQPVTVLGYSPELKQLTTREEMNPSDVVRVIM